MSLEKVFETLEQETNKQREEILEKAKHEAVTIVEEAEKEVSKIIQLSLEKTAITLKGDKAKLQIAVDLNKKRKVIKDKEAQTNRIYSSVEENLKKLRNNQDAYKKLLKNLLVESLEKIHAKNVQVVVDKKDENIVKNVLKESNLNYEVKIGNDSIGGLALQVDNGKIFVNNTLESRFDKARKMLNAQLSEVLFSV